MLPSLLNGPSPFSRHLWDRPLNMLLYNCFMWFRIMTVSYLCGLWFSRSSPSALRGHLFRCRVRISHVNLLCCCCCCSSSAEAAAGKLPSTVYISSLPADRLPYTHKSLPSTATLTSIRYGSTRALPSTTTIFLFHNHCSACGRRPSSKGQVIVPFSAVQWQWSPRNR